MTKQKRSLLRKALLAVKASDEIIGYSTAMVHVDYSLSSKTEGNGSVVYEGEANLSLLGGDPEKITFLVYIKENTVRVVPRKRDVTPLTIGIIETALRSDLPKILSQGNRTASEGSDNIAKSLKVQWLRGLAAKVSQEERYQTAMEAMPHIRGLKGILDSLPHTMESLAEDTYPLERNGGKQAQALATKFGELSAAIFNTLGKIGY